LPSVTNYAGTRLLTRCFEEFGNDPDQALWLGAATTFGTLLVVETIDGYSKKWRFSKEDVVMNAIGTGLGVLLEKSPELDKVLDLRILYWPSAAAKRQGKVDPFGDYSGRPICWLPKHRQYLPCAGTNRSAIWNLPSLRHARLRTNEGPGAIRSRHGYLGISLNLAEILDDTLFQG